MSAPCRRYSVLKFNRDRDIPHQLHDAITCTLERDGYVEILRAKGLL